MRTRLVPALVSTLFAAAPALAQPAAEPPPPPPAEQPVAEPPAPVAAPAPAPTPAPSPAPAPPPPAARPTPPLWVATPPPPPPARPPGVHTHDGFYMRIATGFGVMSEDLRSENTEVYGGKIKGQSTGFATVSELALGGTIARGLVLGGGLYTAQLVSSTYRNAKDSAGDPPPELDPAQRNFTLVGPFIDWYFNEHRGLHAEAAIGLATFSAVGLGSWDSDNPYHATGAGIVLGIGYEWWIADEWSMGVMARMSGAYFVGKDDSNVRWYHSLGISPSPMLTITYH